MAQEKIKKGFFFYFGFFLLILIAAVLVIFVVMLFMPGKSILWLEYFSNSETTYIETTTPQEEGEEGVPINFDTPNFSSVEVNAGYSQVCIQKNFDYKDSGIYIVNEAKGFVASKKARDFEYNVTIENGVLKISVTEQPAFLYFSKYVKIVLQISNTEVNTFENMDVTISNNGGLVDIGGVEVRGKSLPVKIKNLTVVNKTGDIKISSNGDSEYENLSLSTQKGDIDIIPASITAQKMEFELGSGKLNVSVLDGPVYLTSDRGTINITSIKNKLVGNLKNAYVTIGTVTNGVDFSNSEFSSSVVKINNIEQDGINAPNAKDTDFEIGKVGGFVYIETSTGDVIIDGTIAPHSQIKTGTGDITATLTKDASDVLLDTTKGTINVVVPKVANLKTMAKISNREGKTNITMNYDGPYNLRFFYYLDSEDRVHLQQFKFTNVNFNRELPQLNPLSINSIIESENTLVLKCNGQINFNWEKSV